MKRKTTLIWISLAIALALTGSLLAQAQESLFRSANTALLQTAPVEPAPRPNFVLGTTSRLVQVNVIVRDRHGEPVRDLKKEDFGVYDNGKLQQISSFSIHSNALPPSAPALPPNTFTNWPEQKSQVPASATVILFDALNSHIEERQWAKKQVVRFLSTIRPEDRVGVYALGHGLHVLHDFTTDSSLLLKQLARHNGSPFPETAVGGGSSFNSDTDPAAVAFNAWLSGTGVSREESEFYSVNPVAGTYRAVQFIAHHLAGLPGRKNLIWVSGGFPNEAVLALDNANVAIYPVDARGLVVDQRFSAENRPTPSIDPVKKPPDPDPVKKPDPNKPQQLLTLDSIEKDIQRMSSERMKVENQQRKMMELAARTGGRAYVNTKDLAKAIRDAVNDSTLTYTLGFYPGDDANDGKFHKIEVRIPERSGLNLHYRKGYVEPRDARARRNELQDAVWSPVDSSGIGMIVQIAPADAARPNDLNVVLSVDTAGIGLTPEGDRRNGELDIVFMQKDARGRPFDGVNATVVLQLTPESYEKFRQGLRYQQFLPRQTGATHLRVIVGDASTGTMGSVTVPFDQLR
jgi:VWFA-related protein